MKSEPESTSIHVYISVIGGKWKPEVLWFLRKGPQRFGELQRKIPEITQVTLTKNLRELERDGIVIRTVFPEIPPRVEYQLTELGKTAFPVLDANSAWGRMYKKTRRDSSRKEDSP
jgi:DNA-binding HxlR family transcriptional regulator